MLDYRLYFLDDDGRIQGVVDLDCASDAEAELVAETYRDGRPMELRRSDRWLRRFAGDRTPLGSSLRELSR